LTSCRPVSFSRRTLHHGVSKLCLSISSEDDKVSRLGCWTGWYSFVSRKLTEDGTQRVETCSSLIFATNFTTFGALLGLRVGGNNQLGTILTINPTRCTNFSNLFLQ